MSPDKQDDKPPPAAADAKPAAAPKSDPAKAHVASTLKQGVPLVACRFDPTGRYVFAAGQDNRLARWKLEDGSRTDLAGHESWVRALAFDSSGDTLITGGYDGRIKWWPVAAEKPEPSHTIDAHDGWVRALAVSPDGQLLASAGNDHLVKLWKVADGSPAGELKGHEEHVYNVAFHPGGKFLVSADLKLNVRQWSLAELKETRQMKADSLWKYDTTFRAVLGGARGIAFSADGRLLALSGITNVSNAFAGVGNPAVVLLDWESGKQLIEHRLKQDQKGVAWNVALHPDGYTLAASGGGGGGWLIFWKHDQKNEFHKLKLPNTVHDMDLSPDGLSVATAHHDGNLRVTRLAEKAKGQA